MRLGTLDEMTAVAFDSRLMARKKAPPPARPGRHATRERQARSCWDWRARASARRPHVSLRDVVSSPSPQTHVGLGRLRRLHGSHLDAASFRRFVSYVISPRKACRPDSRPLVAYYFMLNLTKAYLTCADSSLTARKASTTVRLLFPQAEAANRPSRYVLCPRCDATSAPSQSPAVAISTTTQRRLFAASGGFCANPLCPSPYLFRDLEQEHVPTVAEMAHVIARSREGPRGEERLPEDERDSYDNLVLLCANCHTVVDDMRALGRYSVGLLSRWKRNHERRVSQVFEAPELQSREELVRRVSALLRQNYAIWSEYGPESEEARRHPGSDAATTWHREAKENILPNNRQILALVDRNARLLSDEELEVVERFRVHARAFARTQLGDPDSAAPRFPPEMREAFSTS